MRVTLFVGRAGRGEAFAGPAVASRQRASERFAPTRRTLCGVLSALLLAGCAGRLPAAALMPPAFRPPALPPDPAATFQAMLSGQPVPPLAALASSWQVGAEPPSGVDVAGDALRIASAPGSRAWASPRLPLTPLTGSRPGQVEELTWEATITLEQRYFIVCELRFAGEPGAMLIQATPFDLQVFEDTARPDGGRGESVSRLAGDGQNHFWRLRLDDAGLQLRLDGSIAWQLAGRRQLARVAFGETRTDAQHGGTMLLRNVVYVRRPG